jgi:leucyl/phenylalanyl-tRNA--protein transferase
LFHSINDDSWISDEMIEGYIELEKRGHILSVEVWDGNKLIGGLYGVNIGKYFSGESMFSLEPNVSKFAFIYLANILFERGYEFIDCQVYSLHFSRFGGINIPRDDFMLLLKKAVKHI